MRLPRPVLDPGSPDPGRRLYRHVYQFDVKMMYPSLVLRFKIDPAAVPEGGLPPGFYARVPDPNVVIETLERYAGDDGVFRPVYSLVKLLAQVRMETKRLKKSDPRFEHLDNAVKAVLNALAYGVMGKRGWGPLSNDAAAEAIFHASRAAQYLLFYEAWRRLPGMGCRPVYSDTDSIFISCNRRLSDSEVNEMLRILNSIIEPFGLELDYEGYWEIMYIHGKKNYILIGDTIVVKGSFFHRLVEYELPQAVADMVAPLLRGEASLDQVLSVIDRAPLDEISIEMHNMLSRMFISTDKPRRGEGRGCVVRTPWVEAPYGRLLRLHASGFTHPRRAPILSQLLARGMQGTVRIDLEYYDGLEIISARGLPGWGTASTIVSRLCGHPAAVILSERMEPYCVRIGGSYYILAAGGGELRVKTFYDSCPGGASLRGLVFTGVSLRRLDPSVYRRAVRAVVATILREIEGAIRRAHQSGK